MEGFSWEVVATVVPHDAHPVLEWCIGNVVGRYDARANVYPRKARPEQKIDAAVALIMGIARCMMMQPGAFGLREPRGDLRLMTAESTGHAGCDCAFSVIDGPVRSAAHDSVGVRSLQEARGPGPRCADADGQASERLFAQEPDVTDGSRLRPGMGENVRQSGQANNESPMRQASSFRPPLSRLPQAACISRRE